MTEKNLDLITMGRAAVDFYAAPIGAPLEEASTFAKYIGGCPANIAIGSSRLGLRTAILSKVGDEAMGRFVREGLKREGVDVSHLGVDRQRLTGLVILGVVPPDHFPLIFYREDCADMAIEIGDVDPEFIASSKALLVTGTHCSREPAFGATKHAVAVAKKVGTQVILDIDYRPVLWGATGHGNGEERYIAHQLFVERIHEIIRHCDLIVGTEEEFLAAAGVNDIEEAMKCIRKASQATLVLKRGEHGCVVYRGIQCIEGASFHVKVLNVLGAGDAFMSGFLRGYLKELPLEECCKLANANGALVVSRHGCSPSMPYWDELLYFMDNPFDLAVTEHMHYQLSLRNPSDNVCFLAFDHRSHFENLSAKCSEERSISDFKKLIYKAFKKVRSENSDINIGVIADGQYAADILRDANFEQLMTGRCIESPNAFPLSFLEQRDAASILRSWPQNQTVKVLCYVTECEKGQAQLSSLKQLYEATKMTGHRLLIEFVDRQNSNSLRVVKEMIACCYREGIYPSWWKLQPMDDPEGWHDIDVLIDHNDPYCHGILLLGEGRPFDELGVSLKNVASHCRKIKGFAVGRTIWGEAAERWFNNEIDNEMAMNAIAERFSCLLMDWNGCLSQT